ncbi:MAG: phosphotransferase [Chloroflexi bacterium]|nr:phosphotransferase [Chloroflexota bacterium]
MAEQPCARILIIDNDERVGLYLREILEARKYTVHVVQASGKNLIEATGEEAASFRPHVAIIDLRLLDDYSDDRTGLDLLGQLRAARCILHSNYLTPEVLRTAQRKYPGVDWADKHEPQMLLSAVDEAARQMSTSLKDVTIQWPPSWDLNQILPPLMPPNDTISPQSLAEDMIVQLFPAIHKLKQEAVDGAIADSHAVVRGRTFVAKVYPDHLEPQILKIARVQGAQDERARYKQFIEQQLIGLFCTRLVNSVEFWDLSGAVYSFMGSSRQMLPTFATFYTAQMDSETILKPLRHFFTIVWRKHYDEPQALHQASLFQAYDEIFSLRTKLDKLDPQISSHWAAQLGIESPDPRQWVQQYGHHSALHGVRQAVTHGDLHGENLFVDGDHAWVIDFERTGPGPILRDFVELEVDIITRLSPVAEIDLATFYKLALVLTEPSEPGAAFSIRHLVAGNLEAIKTVEVVAGLRALAHTVTRYVDHREYIWGLLFDALYIAAIDSITEEQRARALLLSSILCKKLWIWGSVWPPKEWKINGHAV